MRPYLIILYFIVCVIIGAVGDAFFDSSLKIWAHGLDAVEVGLLLSAALIFKPKHWLPFLLTYICWRIVFFDIAYNLSTGLPWDYLGNTSLWDRILSKYPVHGLYFTKGIFAILGVSLPTRYLQTVNKKQERNLFGDY